MKLTYLGTAAAEGCPALFCTCEYCTALRKKNDRRFYRTRSQVLINDDFLVDFPPDTYMHFLERPEFDLPGIKHILITHSHEDHFYPEDILTHSPCFSATLDAPLNVYGNDTVYERLLNYQKNAPAVYKAYDFLKPIWIKPYETVNIAGYEITPIPADHDKGEECYIYVISHEDKTVLYGNDTGIMLSEKAWEKLFDFKYDLVSLDCTAGPKPASSGHMGIPNDIDFAQRLKNAGCVNENTRFVITHFSHFYALPQDELNALLPDKSWSVAYDGMELVI